MLLKNQSKIRPIKYVILLFLLVFRVQGAPEDQGSAVQVDSELVSLPSGDAFASEADVVLKPRKVAAKKQTAKPKVKRPSFFNTRFDVGLVPDHGQIGALTKQSGGSYGTSFYANLKKDFESFLGVDLQRFYSELFHPQNLSQFQQNQAKLAVLDELLGVSKHNLKATVAKRKFLQVTEAGLERREAQLSGTGEKLSVEEQQELLDKEEKEREKRAVLFLEYFDAFEAAIKSAKGCFEIFAVNSILRRAKASTESSVKKFKLFKAVDYAGRLTEADGIRGLNLERDYLFCPTNIGEIKTTQVGTLVAKDLKLYFNNTSSTNGQKPSGSHDSLLAKVRKTKTVFGHTVLDYLFSHPTYDKETLLARQSLIKKLVDNPEFYDQLMSVLKEISHYQHECVNFINGNDEVLGELFPKSFNSQVSRDFYPEKSGMGSIIHVFRKAFISFGFYPLANKVEQTFRNPWVIKTGQSLAFIDVASAVGRYGYHILGFLNATKNLGGFSNILNPHSNETSSPGCWLIGKGGRLYNHLSDGLKGLSSAGNFKTVLSHGSQGIPYLFAIALWAGVLQSIYKMTDTIEVEKTADGKTINKKTASKSLKFFKAAMSLIFTASLSAGLYGVTQFTDTKQISLKSLQGFMYFTLKVLPKVILARDAVNAYAYGDTPANNKKAWEAVRTVYGILKVFEDARNIYEFLTDGFSEERTRKQSKELEKIIKTVKGLREIALGAKQIERLFSKYSVDEKAITLLPELRYFNNCLRVVNGKAVLNQELKNLVSSLASLPEEIDQATALGMYRTVYPARYMFGPVMEALGEVDAISSAATLIKLHQDQGNGFNFVEFLSETSSAMILPGLWYPYLPASIAVGNDVLLPGDSGLMAVSGQESIQHMIISGKNSGGKTTLLRGALFGVLTSLVWGIVSARPWTDSVTGELRNPIVPLYQCVSSALSVEDSQADDNSKFVAQVKAVEAERQSLNMYTVFSFLYQQPVRPKILLLDEIYSATSATNGAPLAIATMENLLTVNKNINLLVSTHFSSIDWIKKYPFASKIGNFVAISDKNQKDTYKIGRTNFGGFVPQVYEDKAEGIDVAANRCRVDKELIKRALEIRDTIFTINNPKK